LSRADLPTKAASSIEYARELVNDVLQQGYGMTAAFALEEGRGVSLDFAEVDVVREIKEVAIRLQRTNARDDIRFQFSTAHNFPSLMLDRQAFGTVIFNLIQNAMKFADRNSEVCIECDFDHTNMPIVKIKSVGEPISPDERQRIFGRHVRGRTAERGRMRTGAGLGLWVSQQLMRELGGDLTLELNPSHPRLSVFILHFGLRSLHGSEARPLDRQ
jgi:signal transduction histidine kinase